jgi:hypothetical protein
MFVVFLVLLVVFLVGLLFMVLSTMFSRALRGFGTCHERRKAFKQLVEHFSACKQLLDLHADIDTLIRRLIKGTIIAGKGH